MEFAYIPHEFVYFHIGGIVPSAYSQLTWRQALWPV